MCIEIDIKYPQNEYLTFFSSSNEQSFFEGEFMKLAGLVIRDPWISLIMSGQKTWEIRGSATRKRGLIALIKGGSKHILGVCEILAVHGPLTFDEYSQTQNKHLTPPIELSSKGLPYPKTYAWELGNVIPFKSPVQYTHPKGAITWVTLDLDIEDILCLK